MAMYCFEPKDRLSATCVPTPKGQRNGQDWRAGKQFEIADFDGLKEAIAAVNKRCEGIDGKPAMYAIKAKPAPKVAK